MRSNLQYAMTLDGFACDAEKLAEPGLVVEVIKELGQYLGLKYLGTRISSLNPFCVKMTHNTEPRKSFIIAGVVTPSRTVLVDTIPGQKYVQLRIFSSRGLKGFRKTAERVIRENFSPTRLEVDIQKLEKLQ